MVVAMTYPVRPLQLLFSQVSLKGFQGSKLKGIYKTIECKFSKYVVKFEVGV
jgi:hypothetical protein